MFKNLLLLIVSTGFALCMLEVGLRIVMPERLAFVPALYNNDTTYVPNQSQRSRHLEWDYEIRINGDGFRNDKTLAAIPPGTLLALGDSFTEGHGVALDEAFAKVLERQLVAAGFATHIYNAGHYGTDLPSYRRVYEKIFSDAANIERVVIGLFIGNDVINGAPPPDGRLLEGNEFGDGWRYRLKVFLGSNVAIYAALNYAIKTNPPLFKLCQSLGACYRPRPPNIYATDVIASAVPYTVDYTVNLVADIRADGREVLVVVIPTREQIDDEFWSRVVSEYGTDAASNRYRLNHELTAALRDSGVDVLDLTDAALRLQRDAGKRLYFRFDGHWNPAGHDFAAQQIARHLLKN